ncbi:hypothetical protein G6F56_012080 [Rhizopus delemar]|nr:hypothetical protein G6F56_012080 [Rhizopus delemar]
MLKISDENGVPRAFQRELPHTLNNFFTKHLNHETIENLGGRCPIPDTITTPHDVSFSDDIVIFLSS